MPDQLAMENQLAIGNLRLANVAEIRSSLVIANSLIAYCLLLIAHCLLVK
jgi:hypothetical protein